MCREVCCGAGTPAASRPPAALLAPSWEAYLPLDLAPPCRSTLTQEAHQGQADDVEADELGVKQRGLLNHLWWAGGLSRTEGGGGRVASTAGVCNAPNRCSAAALLASTTCRPSQCLCLPTAAWPACCSSQCKPPAQPRTWMVSLKNSLVLNWPPAA